MTNSKDLILKLKEVNAVKKMSYSEIEAITERNGEHVSIPSISRVFAEGSENGSFRYEGTLKPIANAILDIDVIEEDDDLDTQALKIMLQYKAEKIRELEAALDHEKVKHLEKIEKEREQFHKSLDFLKEQVRLKDERITQLMENNVALTKHILDCPYKKGCGNEH